MCVARSEWTNDWVSECKCEMKFLLYREPFKDRMNDNRIEKQMRQQLIYIYMYAHTHARVHLHWLLPPKIVLLSSSFIWFYEFYILCQQQNSTQRRQNWTRFYLPMHRMWIIIKILYEVAEAYEIATLIILNIYTRETFDGAFWMDV